MLSRAIDVSLVEDLIAGQFPAWRHLPVTPVETQGWDSRTFRLGESMAVRLPSDAEHSLQVEKEQRWLPLLSPQLPLPIPEPIALGRPQAEYPWNWSVRRWLDGETAAVERIGDLTAFAADLAAFLTALYSLDARDGPHRARTAFSEGVRRRARAPWATRPATPQSRGRSSMARADECLIDEVLAGD